MYRIALINMPFAMADIPSIALSQLRSRVQEGMGDRVSCDVFYINLDFVNYLGLPLFQAISGPVQANTSGLGDWFFSAVAFPDLPDDAEGYLNRHFAEQRMEVTRFKEQLLSKRRTAGRFLDSLIDRYKLTGYDLVGFTSMFCQNIGSFSMAKKLKQRRPEMVVVMGGANCETPMGAVIAKNVPEIDFVFSGPALQSFPRLVGHLLAGQEPECHRIPGVLSRRKLALTSVGQSREIGDELDIDVKIPLDYDEYFALLERKMRGLPIKPRVPFETSRGCWWGERSHCTFCGLNGMSMKYRAMAPAVALETLQELFERYGARTDHFESVDNILPREYLTEVLPYLVTPPHAVLFYEVKADLKKHEMEALARARVLRIQPGIEALSTLTLKLMKKGTTAFQNLRFLIDCQMYDVLPLWNLLVGFPGEPESVYEKYCRDLPLLTHLRPPTGAFPVRFDRYSPYHKLAAEYGLKLRPSDFYSAIYPFPAEDLEHLAYFFRDEDFKAPYLMGTAKWLGKLREHCVQWQSRWQRDPKPELVFREEDGRVWVYDSRGTKPIEHRLEAPTLQVLKSCTKQAKIPYLASRLEGMSADEVEREVKLLRDRGLLFEEDGAYMSIVVQPEATERESVGLLPGELGNGGTVQPMAM
ncbi:MAG TPA: RiPP maturation radical SAM C-methyltransferase [Thermoanaerobaculia bacterium]|nr:RiPP maturation radical SAM C-methyltransferase [Thermoanaerobaculia bacterium]